MYVVLRMCNLERYKIEITYKMIFSITKILSGISKIGYAIYLYILYYIIQYIHSTVCIVNILLSTLLNTHLG